MQLPQEHPKHTHDVLRVLPSPGTITAVTSLIFALRAIKKNVSNRSRPPARDRRLAARDASRGLGLCATPLPDQNQASLLSPLATTSHRPLAPLTPHLHLENTLALLFIPRHPSYAHSSESFWSRFYYTSLELPLPSSP